MKHPRIIATLCLLSLCLSVELVSSEETPRSKLTTAIVRDWTLCADRLNALYSESVFAIKRVQYRKIQEQFRRSKMLGAAISAQELTNFPESETEIILGKQVKFGSVVSSRYVFANSIGSSEPKIASNISYTSDGHLFRLINFPRGGRLGDLAEVNNKAPDFDETSESKLFNFQPHDSPWSVISMFFQVGESDLDILGFCNEKQLPTFLEDVSIQHGSDGDFVLLKTNHSAVLKLDTSLAYLPVRWEYSPADGKSMGRAEISYKTVILPEIGKIYFPDRIHYRLYYTEGGRMDVFFDVEMVTQHLLITRSPPIAIDIDNPSRFTTEDIHQLRSYR